MAQRSYFFNDTETETKVYFAEDEARFNYLMMAGQGIAKQDDQESYPVSPKQNMVVTVGAGSAFIKGHLHEVYDIAEDLELDAADPVNDRIDRVVLQFVNEPTQREIRLAVLKGNPSSSPTPPSVTRDEDKYELSLARVLVKAGKSFIETSEITDEKNNPLVCGYSPLHNLLRGIRVDENGIASLPNQSYFEVIHQEPANVLIPDRTSVYLNLSPVVKDNQGEVDSVNNEFIPKTSGVYMFFMYTRFKNWPAGSVPDVQLSVDVNGAYVSSLVLARATNISGDNIFQGSMFYELNAGDIFRFRAYVFDAPATTEILNYRIMATKLS